jgi:hypothetical protein
MMLRVWVGLRYVIIGVTVAMMLLVIYSPPTHCVRARYTTCFEYGPDYVTVVFWLLPLAVLLWVLTRKRTNSQVRKSPGVQDTKAGASPEYSDSDEELTSSMRSPEVH